MNRSYGINQHGLMQTPITYYLPELSSARQEWLASLEVGDTVSLNSISLPGPKHTSELATVSNFTPNTITVVLHRAKPDSSLKGPRRPNYKLFPRETGVRNPTSDPLNGLYLSPLSHSPIGAALAVATSNLVEYILTYESDTFSASAECLNSEQAQAIAAKLIAAIDFDGSTLTDLISKLQEET